MMSELLKISEATIKAGDSVEVPEEWERFSVYIAKRRGLRARNGGIPTKKISTSSDVEIDRDGMMGEIAFCMMVNAFPDAVTTEALKQADLWLGDGTPVDVKTTKYENGKLLAHTSKIEKIDEDLIYVLMTGKARRYVFRGWAKAVDLFVSYNIGDIGYGNGYFLEQRQLNQTLEIR